MKRWILLMATCLCWGTAAGQEVLLTVALDSSGTGSGSVGKGTGYLILSSDRQSVRYHFTVNRLSGPVTAAHFHLLPSGSAVQPITFTGNDATGTWSLPDSMFDHLFSERIYVNVHTGSAPGGEIRGFPQPSQYGFRFDLDGAQAGTSSAGKGTGYVRVDRTSGSTPELRYRFTYSGMSGTITGSHFHALPGGGVVQGVTFTDSTSDGVWTSPTDSVWWKFVRGQIYMNVHSTAAGGGEIRSAARVVGEAPFVGRLDGTQAGTASTGKGTVWAVLRPDGSIRYSATYNRLLGNLTASHFHESRTGGVVHGVTFASNHLSSTWPAPSDQSIADLFRGRIYLNVHSSVNAGGEIRGDLSFHDGVVTGELSGAAAGTPSTAKGTIWGKFREDTLEYSATIAGLTSGYTASHFHLAPGGSVLSAIPLVDSTTYGFWPYGSHFLSLLRGNVYFNVHSVTFSGGEIRANLKIGTGVATHVETVEAPLPGTFTLAQNFPNPFNPTTTIEYAVGQSGRVMLEVYNVLGQRVAVLVDGIVAPGVYRATFDGGMLPSGVYFSRLSGDQSASVTRRLLLMK